MKREAVELYVTGLSMRAIARKLGVSATTVLRWIRTCAQKTYAKPAPAKVNVVEIDEMWHYIDSKKQMLDMEGLLSRYRRINRLGMWRSQPRYSLENDGTVE